MQLGFRSQNRSMSFLGRHLQAVTPDMVLWNGTGLMTYLLLLAPRCCWPARLSAILLLQKDRRPLARQEPAVQAATVAEEAVLLSPDLGRKRGQEEGRRVEAVDPPP